MIFTPENMEKTHGFSRWKSEEEVVKKVGVWTMWNGELL